MRKVLAILFLISLLGSVSALAANPEPTTTEKKSVEVSLDSIETIMTEYSPTLKKIKNDRDAAVKTYRDMKKDMNDLQDIIGDAPDTAAGWTASHQASTQYSNLKDSFDKLKLSMDTAQEQYVQNLYQQVVTVKKQYLSYGLDQLKLVNTQQQIQTQTSTLSNAQQQVTRGYLSQKTYDNMAQGMEDLRDSLQMQTSTLDADLRNLRLSLGVPEDTALVMTPLDLSAFSFHEITNLDLDADIQAMLENSTTLRNAQLTYESYRDHKYASDPQTASAKIAWEQAQQSAVAEMTTLYQSLQDGYQTLLTARAKLATQETTLANARAKAAQGYVSQKALTDIQDQTTSMESSVSAQEIALYMNYLTYDQMRTV